ncbi:hypothetical protein BMT54_08055 [Pasteurellaceae bacterium 15-036681]|nr:hypothetical protein BMT54_08055 [Pasteurellaceae bacterium 15-036681]
MSIHDKAYAEKKLSQVGYYRLSGFEINLVRNLSAHHSRVWNRAFTDIAIPDFTKPHLAKFKKASAYFSGINLDQKAKSRLFSRIVVLWYLVSQTSTNYQWIEKVETLFKEFPTVPNAKLDSLGIMDGDLSIFNNFKGSK